jgi:hypothetical protein
MIQPGHARAGTGNRGLPFADDSVLEEPLSTSLR